MGKEIFCGEIIGKKNSKNSFKQVDGPADYSSCDFYVDT